MSLHLLSSLFLDDLGKFPEICWIHFQFLKNFVTFGVLEGNARVYDVLEFIFVPQVLLESINFGVQLLIKFSLNLLIVIIPPGLIISEPSHL